MFERFSQDARRLIFFARHEASMTGSPIIETEHLWLGALRQDPAAVARIAPVVTRESLDEQIRARHGSAEPIPTPVNLPLSDRAKLALTRAAAPVSGAALEDVSLEDVLRCLLETDSTAS